MNAVITGDIINSRRGEIGSTLDALKHILDEYGKTPSKWEMYRGDSFQLVLDCPEESLRAAMRLKASMKTEQGRDVRMAIGIGTIAYSAPKVTESNGDAFIRSGEQFERLSKDKVNLAVRSPWPNWDEEMNLYLRLALIVMDDWSQASAEYMGLKLAQDRLGQEEIAERLGISQSSVSGRKKRARPDELGLVEHRYRQTLTTLMS